MRQPYPANLSDRNSHAQPVWAYFISLLGPTPGIEAGALTNQRRASEPCVDFGMAAPGACVVEMLRLCADCAPRQVPGWLAAIRDPIVGRALTDMRAAPMPRWTVMSSPLGAPMQYLTELRLLLAAGLLRDQKLPVAALAYRVGYDSEEAFSRAFKRVVRRPPGQWRATQA